MLKNRGFLTGTRYIQTGGTTVVNGVMTQSAIDITGGVLQGAGNIVGPVKVDGGTVAPGNSPGTLTIAGDLTMTSGSLLFEIAGTDAGQFDVLHVTGFASFSAGSATFSFVNGFLPTVGNHWKFLHADGGTAGFETLQISVLGLPGNYIFSTSVTNGLDLSLVEVAAVPEPGALFLFSAGFCLIVFGARRRRSV